MIEEETRPTEADKAYCRKCVYQPPLEDRAKYLCDYLTQTGQLRGGRYGCGCTKRILRGAGV